MPDRDELEQPGRWTRRRAIQTSGAWVVGAGLVAAGCGEETSPSKGAAPAGSSPGASTPASCVLTPEQTEGPYYIDDSKVRRDITEGRDGAALELVLTVQDAEGCEPIPDATVEVWHCDALGVYSGFTAAGSGSGGPGAGGPPPGAPPRGAPNGAPSRGDQPPGNGQNPGYGRDRSAAGSPTDEETFLRGAQRSDRRGQVRFRTLFPGWYEGRTPHIHLKVHVSGEEVHTGQLYFDDAATRAVYSRSPYSSRGQPSTTNPDDGIYSQGGRQSTVALTRAGSGYVGRLALGVRA